MSSHRRSCRGNVNGASSLSSLKCQLIISTYLKTPWLPRLNFFECLYSIRKGFQMFFFLATWCSEDGVCGWPDSTTTSNPLTLFGALRQWQRRIEEERERERENEKECCWSCRVRCLSLLFLAGAAVCNSSGPSRLLLLLPLPVASCKLLLHLQTIANNYLCGPGAACCKYLLEKSGCHFGIGYCATPQPLFFLAHQAVNDQSTWSSPYPGQSIIMLPYIWARIHMLKHRELSWGYGVFGGWSHAFRLTLPLLSVLI